MSTFIPQQDTPFTATQVPVDYVSALEAIAPTITDKIDEQQAPGETWYDSLARLLPILAATEQQRELLKVQTERAKQGLPPLNTSQYGTGVQVGLDSSTKNLLIYGGIGLAVFLLMNQKRR